MKEIEENKNKWKHIPCSSMKRLTIIKIIILPRAIEIFNTTPVKNSQWHFFTEMEKLILTFKWNLKVPPNNQKNLEKEQKWKTHMS